MKITSSPFFHFYCEHWINFTFKGLHGKLSASSAIFRLFDPFLAKWRVILNFSRLGKISVYSFETPSIVTGNIFSSRQKLLKFNGFIDRHLISLFPPLYELRWKILQVSKFPYCLTYESEIAVTNRRNEL